jgi:hypothetical protein
LFVTSSLCMRDVWLLRFQLRRCLYFCCFLLCSIYNQNDVLVWEFFSSTPCPDRLWSPPSLLSNGYRGLYPWG